MHDDITIITKPYAVLHKKICDNYSECPSKLACEEASRKEGRQSAIYIDENNKIAINKANCIGCGTCVEYCALFRIVASRYKELEVQEEFDNDPRTAMDFTVERFGCDVVSSESYLLKDISEVEKYIAESGQDVNILEFVDESHIMCPFQAIDVNFVKEQFKCLNNYKKFVISGRDYAVFNEIERLFSIKQFPAILLLYDGQILGTPITDEYRVRKEEDRMELQIRLQREFSSRLGRFMNNGTYFEDKSV